jgi:hypothetical protein
VRFTPKRITQLFHELRDSDYSNGISPEITKHLPNWYRCEYSSGLLDELVYLLVISVSLEDSGALVFHFEYSVSFKWPYLGKRRIMLCPHRDALQHLGVHTRPLPQFLSYDTCGIKLSISLSEDSGKYLIQYTRKFDKYQYNIHESYSLDKFSDYIWEMYRISPYQ